MEMKNNEQREKRLSEYTDENFGITELKIISGIIKLVILNVFCYIKWTRI